MEGRILIKELSRVVTLILIVSVTFVLSSQKKHLTLKESKKVTLKEF